MQPSPTGSGAPNWRTMCGSFVECGPFGSANDFMLQMFITCSDPPFQPSRIVMGYSVFQYWQRAEERRLQFLVRHIRRILEDPKDWMKNVQVANLDSSSEILKSLHALERAITSDGDRYFGATVIRGRDVADDTMLFYDGGPEFGLQYQLVAECSGWTA